VASGRRAATGGGEKSGRVSRDLWLAVFVGDGLAREVELSFEEFGATGQPKISDFFKVSTIWTRSCRLREGQIWRLRGCRMRVWNPY